MTSPSPPSSRVQTKPTTMSPTLTLTLISVLLSLLPPSLSSTFTVTNNCAYPIWPGLLSGAGTPPLSSTGFLLSPLSSRSLDAPSHWSGRLWARTGCSLDPATNRFTCATGDCGSGAVECSGAGAIPPATLAEFTLDGSGGLDFYDVSLVDGYNLPMTVAPIGGGGGRCEATGCPVDLNGSCPAELRVAGVAACRSACEAFGSPEYCCSGAYGTPGTCAPSVYSQFFKNACPRAYSYAYDDASSTFTCAGAGGYTVTFCPTTTSLKSSGVHPRAASLPTVNDTMVYMSGEMEASTGAPPPLAAAGGTVLLFLPLGLCAMVSRLLPPRLM